MNELSRANKWLYARLSGDATIIGIVSTRIYARKAPKDAEYPLIVYNYQAGSDTQWAGTKRILAQAVFQVKVICKGKPTANVHTVADRIDALIGIGIHETQDDVRISSRRESALEFEEDTPNADKTFYHLGGLYRLHIHEA